MSFGEYLLTIAAASFVGIIADILADAFFKNIKSTEKYIRFGISVCIACSVILPLPTFLDSTDISLVKLPADYPEAETTNADSLYILQKECEKATADEIYQKTNIQPLSISVELVQINDAPKAVKAVVILDSSDKEKIPTVKQIADMCLDTDTEVKLSENEQGSHK